ncbi:MAG: hypothetical protein MSG64_02335 [Pyrinomonadaceae bacterium MAG19_C2-C3]|nr:hypothetical protein [Pyrinomonadaceae bacterium MAG19_C2-C3]
MIERELEVMDNATEEASDIAVAVADLRDTLNGKSADEIKQSLSTLLERINGIADVLTALSIDLFKVNAQINGAGDTRNNANQESNQEADEA